jgi:hypothetical protein
MIILFVCHLNCILYPNETKQVTDIYFTQREGQFPGGKRDKFS